MSAIRGAAIGTRSTVDPFQSAPFVHRDVVALVALDFILWVIPARVMRVSLVIGVLPMNLDDPAADMTRLPSSRSRDRQP